jgi:hypothetical protein
MPDHDQIKTQLVRDLWLPIIKNGGDILYPRLRKNKKMKLLTLTTDTNFEEITTLVSNKLTQKERIIVWTQSYFKKVRLETGISPLIVVGGIRYEDSISSSSFPLNDHLPFDVINLDFSSQDPSFDAGRVEKEIISLEKTIRMQKNRNSNNFILIYTTILNSNHLNLTFICSASDTCQVMGWQGLTTGEYPSDISDNNQKINCIESILCKISQKYNYNYHINKMNMSLNGDKIVFSMAGLLRKSGGL